MAIFRAILCCLALFPFSVQAEGKKYALLIGVEAYDPTQLARLSYAEDDVIALGKALQDQDFDVLVMTSQAEIPSLDPVTAEDILLQFERRLKNRDPQDTIVIMLSGHGVQLRSDVAGAAGVKETYFCPRRADLHDRSTLVPLSKVMQSLEKCSARRKLLIVDACRNEVEPKDVKDKSVEIELDPAGVSRRSVPTGMLALFSCAAKERSYEFQELKHSVFTFHLLQYLEGAAPIERYPNGELSITELANFAARSTRDFVDHRLAKDQQPELLSPGGTRDWSLGIRRAKDVGNVVDSNKVVSAKCFLDVDQLRAGSTCRFAVVLDVKDGWYINANPPFPVESLPTTISISSQLGITLSDIEYPPGEDLEIDKSVRASVYRGKVTITGTLTVPKNAGDRIDTFNTKLRYQAGNEHLKFSTAPKLLNMPSTPKIAGSNQIGKQVNKHIFLKANRSVTK